jgi:hypothetical protein
MGAPLLLADYGPTWNWYLQIEVIDQNFCRVLRHWRAHRREHRLPDDVAGQFVLHEDRDRTARAVSANLGAGFRRLAIDNPAHVFNFPGEAA